MSSLICGVTVILIERRVSGMDPFGHPTYEDVETDIPNVLIAPAGSDDVISATELEGKKLVYTLAIPKGDPHDWTDVRVRFFGKTFKSFGSPQQGIEENIPLDWNKKVMVELYEQ